MIHAAASSTPYSCFVRPDARIPFIAAPDPAARIDYEPDLVRTAILASWPEDLDHSRARNDWGWEAAYPWDRAFEEYLVPNVTAKYR